MLHGQLPVRGMHTLITMHTCVTHTELIVRSQDISATTPASLKNPRSSKTALNPLAKHLAPTFAHVLKNSRGSCATKKATGKGIQLPQNVKFPATYLYCRVLAKPKLATATRSFTTDHQFPFPCNDFSSVALHRIVVHSYSITLLAHHGRSRPVMVTAFSRSDHALLSLSHAGSHLISN
jgi:hypothetical protein